MGSQQPSGNGRNTNDRNSLKWIVFTGGRKESEVNLPVDEKPWLDGDGKTLSDDQLRIVSKDWSVEVWETFLNQTVDKPLNEVNKSAWNYAKAIDEMKHTFWSEGGPTESNDERGILVRHKIRCHLTGQQQVILKLYFHDGLSERQVAKRLGLHYAQVHTSKRNSLNKLKHLLERDICISTRGKRSKLSAPRYHPSMNLKIYEVYLEEVAGPLWCRR